MTHERTPPILRSILRSTPARPAVAPRACGLFRSRSIVLSRSAALLAAALVAGCATPPPPTGERVGMGDAEQAAADRAFAREPFEDQVRAGVLRQRTLYEHHFEHDAAALNSLGRRDLAILAKGMSASGGRIAVERGSAGKDLYAARLSTVRAGLASAGIPARRVKLDDGPPGGRGVSTSEAILIRAEIRDEPMRVESGEILSNDPNANASADGGAQ